MEWGAFALAVPAVLLSGISKGGFGSGVSFVSAAIMALVLEPAAALALMLPLLMLIDVASLRAYWRRWHAPSARILILGALPGTVLGALLYRATDDDVLRLAIGAIALGFPLFQAARARGWIRTGHAMGPWAGSAIGVVVGFTSFVSHAGGPPAAIYLLSRPEVGKTAYQATTVILFWVVNIAKAALYVFLGLFTLDLIGATLLLAPVALAGTWIGVRAHTIVPERVFFAVTYVLLAATGIKLIWDALT